MFRLISGQNSSSPSKGATPSNANANLIVHANTTYPITGGYGRAVNPSANGGADDVSRIEPSVGIAMNEWTTMKVVLDPLGENHGAQPGLGRVYFTNGVYETNTLVPMYDEDKPPAIQLYFPASTSDRGLISGTNWPYVNSGTDASVNGNWNWVDHPEYWPRYVSMWLTNYKYADSTLRPFGRQADVNENILIAEFPAG